MQILFEINNFVLLINDLLTVARHRIDNFIIRLAFMYVLDMG